MNSANARTGKHRHRGFRDHRHIDGNPVAFIGAEGLERIGEKADLVVQLTVTDLDRGLAVVTLPDNRRLIAARV